MSGDSIAGHHELFVWILRTVAPGTFLDDLLIFGDDSSQCLGIEVSIKLGFFLLLLRFKHFIESRLRNI